MASDLNRVQIFIIWQEGTMFFYVLLDSCELSEKIHTDRMKVRNVSLWIAVFV